MIQDQMGNTICSFQCMETDWLKRAEVTEQQSEGCLPTGRHMEFDGKES
jgi:hypothetical protein